MAVAVQVIDVKKVLKKAHRRFAKAKLTMSVTRSEGTDTHIITTPDDAQFLGTMSLRYFIGQFGDLIEKGNYTAATWRRRNKKEDFGYPEHIFDEWKQKGVLR
jgi:hypothetical protein